MNREIEFRVKSKKTNKWYYGSPMFYDDGSFTFFDKELLNECDGCLDAYSHPDIDDNTLGQYTGLKDKDGTKIYEGDVVRELENQCKYEVRFERIGYDSGCGLTGFVCIDGDYCKDRDTDTKEEFYTCDRWIDLKDIEVVGNIYDNNMEEL